jgi:hypothetical protein
MNHPDGDDRETADDDVSPHGLVGEDRFRTTHDPSSDRTLCSAVVDAVAAVTGESPTELPPLHGSVDPDALNTFVYGSDGGYRGGSDVTVSFEFSETLVTVGGGGTIVVEGVNGR